MQRSDILLYFGITSLAVAYYCYISAFSLAACVVISSVGGVLSYWIILEYLPLFMERKMFGHDMCKPASADPVPEPVGVISAGVYLIVMLTILPFILYEWTGTELVFPREKLLSFLSALLGICSAILLGFVDDVFDLRWRHKILLPTLSALPILLVYHATGSSTTVYIPNQLQIFLPLGKSVDIGILYYVYMAMMIIFCTNAINILAGINGLEVGQAVVIAASAIAFNTIQLLRLDEEKWCHLLPLYFLIPFLTIAFVLLIFNWYPARVFVGDTFCYWAGMTLGSVCILGHFSKTMALLFIPQVFNFLYSVPQLFHLLPCPRHRLPKYDLETDTVGMSLIEFELIRVSKLGRIIFWLFSKTGLIYYEQFEKEGRRYFLTILAAAFLLGVLELMDTNEQLNADQSYVEDFW